MVLQRYRATQELGKGSFGTVYLTEGRRDKKTYVVKVVDNMRENTLKIQEIRVMLHLKHRNIIEMCDFYTSNNQLCIVMDYADGGDLRNEIVKARNANVPIPEEMISIWMIQVCWALEFAHSEQIIHRDIKPSNIFLMADGRNVKVGDFGIAKVLDAAIGKDQSVAPDADGRVGTKRYMAPEVLNRQEYSNKADVWSLGCVMFELTTLQHPTYEQSGRMCFEWIPDLYSSNLVDIMRVCITENPAVRPRISEVVAKLIAPCRTSPLLQQIYEENIHWCNRRLEQQRHELDEQMMSMRESFSPEIAMANRISTAGQPIKTNAVSVPQANPQISDLATNYPQQNTQQLARSRIIPNKSTEQGNTEINRQPTPSVPSNPAPSEVAEFHEGDQRKSILRAQENGIAQNMLNKQSPRSHPLPQQIRFQNPMPGPSNPAAAINFSESQPGLRQSASQISNPGNVQISQVGNTNSLPVGVQKRVAAETSMISPRAQVATYSSAARQPSVPTAQAQNMASFINHVATGVSNRASTEVHTPFESPTTPSGEEEVYSDYDLMAASTQSYYGSSPAVKGVMHQGPEIHQGGGMHHGATTPSRHNPPPQQQAYIVSPQAPNWHIPAPQLYSSVSRGAPPPQAPLSEPTAGSHIQMQKAQQEQAQSRRRSVEDPNGKIPQGIRGAVPLSYAGGPAVDANGITLRQATQQRHPDAGPANASPWRAGEARAAAPQPPPERRGSQHEGAAASNRSSLDRTVLAAFEKANQLGERGAPDTWRPSAHNAAPAAAPPPQGAGGAARPRSMPAADTTRVIEDLERIRSGIRETLAAAGKPPPPPLAPVTNIAGAGKGRQGGAPQTGSEPPMSKRSLGSESPGARREAGGKLIFAEL